jgi:hypothetical protein
MVFSGPCVALLATEHAVMHPHPGTGRQKMMIEGPSLHCTVLLQKSPYRRKP